MKKNIIDRKNELSRLSDAVRSNRPELIAVYGRRRVGKTFMIKEYFNNKFDFYATGIFEGKKKDELAAFIEGFPEEFRKKMPPIKDWMEAFIALREYLKTKKRKRLIVFLDELPWFDVPPSRFLQAFEWFWNSWGSTRNKLKMIVCGSATSWMRNKFISGKGGLYNRTTTQLYLSPFKLHDTKLLLKHYGIKWSNANVLETYMVLGGIPYYLQMLRKELSLTENIDYLFFRPDSPLRHEYDFLLRSLFKDDEYYKKIIDTIARKNKGISRKEIISEGHITDNGILSRALKNLEDCDFIRQYQSFEKSTRDSLYQLTDPFILFFKRFVEKYKGADPRHWSNNIQSPRYNTWSGIAFEQVCLIHLEEIKTALGITGISTSSGCWYFPGNKDFDGAQIDLLIDRVDRIINICEMKYSKSKFEVTKKLERKVREREDIFIGVTKTGKTISNILVTPWGEKRGKYHGLFSKTITSDAFFK